MNIYFETYGCTSNKADTKVMEGLAKKLDNKVVDDIKEADLVVLNTCVVIGKTEQRMLKRIRELADKNLVVAGCLSETNREKVREINENIDLLSPREVGEFANLIGDETKDLSKWEAPSETNGVEAQVQISEGCVGNCSYCITKFARGSLRTFPRNQIIRKVDELVEAGAKEIQLTAQDTATYGLRGENDLVDLVGGIDELPGDFRVRVGMMNPSNVIVKTDRLLRVFDLNKVYNFLHLPIQSGSNKILRDMNRGYSVEDFREIVRRFRQKTDGILSTDVIAGFPTETKKDFEKTLSLIKSIEPEILNITRYSPRPRTKASEMKEIDSQEKKNRSKELTKIKKEIGRNRRKRFIDETREVLVTGVGKNQTMVGKDEAYNTVVIEGDAEVGEFTDVKIHDCSFAYLEGTPK